MNKTGKACLLEAEGSHTDQRGDQAVSMNKEQQDFI
jgi:hypothetical protein